MKNIGLCIIFFSSSSLLAGTNSPPPSPSVSRTPRSQLERFEQQHEPNFPALSGTENSSYPEESEVSYEEDDLSDCDLAEPTAGSQAPQRVEEEKACPTDPANAEQAALPPSDDAQAAAQEPANPHKHSREDMKDEDCKETPDERAAKRLRSTAARPQSPNFHGDARKHSPTFFSGK